MFLFGAGNDKCGRDIQRDEIYPGVSEYPPIKLAPQGRVVKLDEHAAGAQTPEAGLGDGLCQRFREHDKRYARHNVVGGFDSALGQVLADVFGRVVHQRQARIVEFEVKFLDKNSVHLEHQNLRVWPHPFQNILRDGPVARPQFQDYFGLVHHYFFGDMPA